MLDYSKIKKIKVGNHDMWIYNGELSSLGNSEFTEYVRYINLQHNKKEGTKMSNKFTEEQYQKIVDAWEETYDYVLSVKNVIETVESFGEVYQLQIGEALALANAVSTEWAHEQFVEKEKRYMWTSKKKDKKGFSTRIMIDHDGLVKTYPIQGITSQSDDEQLTESEILDWGYNPEMFDKEEVD